MNWNIYLQKKDKEYVLHLANGLFIKKDLNDPIEEAFFDVVEDDYYSDVTEVDFKKKTETLNIINKWIEKQTKGTFKNLLNSSKNPNMIINISVKRYMTQCSVLF